MVVAGTDECVPHSSGVGCRWLQVVRVKEEWRRGVCRLSGLGVIFYFTTIILYCDIAIFVMEHICECVLICLDVCIFSVWFLSVNFNF